MIPHPETVQTLIAKWREFADELDRAPDKGSHAQRDIYRLRKCANDLDSLLSSLPQRGWQPPEGVIVSEYQIGPNAPHRHFVPTIKRMGQREGADKWAAYMRPGVVVGRSGTQTYEPQPSSRTDEYLAEFRFDTPADAINALLVVDTEPT